MGLYLVSKIRVSRFVRLRHATRVRTSLLHWFQASFRNTMKLHWAGITSLLLGSPVHSVCSFMNICRFILRFLSPEGGRAWRIFQGHSASYEATRFTFSESSYLVSPFGENDPSSIGWGQGVSGHRGLLLRQPFSDVRTSHTPRLLFEKQLLRPICARRHFREDFL